MRKTSSEAQGTQGSSVFTKVTLSCSSCWFDTFGWFGFVSLVSLVDFTGLVDLVRWVSLVGLAALVGHWKKHNFFSVSLRVTLIHPFSIQDGYSRLKGIKNCVWYCIYRDYQNIAKGTTDPRVEFSFTKVNCWGHITNSNKDLDQISSSEHWPSINFCFKSCLNLNFKILTKVLCSKSGQKFSFKTKRQLPNLNI